MKHYHLVWIPKMKVISSPDSSLTTIIWIVKDSVVAFCLITSNVSGNGIGTKFGYVIVRS